MQLYADKMCTGIKYMYDFSIRMELHAYSRLAKKKEEKETQHLSQPKPTTIHPYMYTCQYMYTP